jgi:pyrroline-5-carboxylate reductase
VKIGFIGAGKMGEAIIAAFLESKKAAAHQLFASDVNPSRRRHLKRRYGINLYSRNRNVAGSAQVLFLAIKPGELEGVLREIKPDVSRQHLVVSIVAGRRMAGIQAILPEAKVVRVMPNLACQVAEGMSVFCGGARATAADRRLVHELLSSFGKVLELPEDQFDVVTALSGSGPAFLAYALNAMTEAAVAEGLDRTHALLLAEQTMLGTARVLIEKGIDPPALIAAVASPKGTTAAGLAVLDGSDFRTIVGETIRAATRRSRELSAPTGSPAN